jgi:hypothetical protein
MTGGERDGTGDETPVGLIITNGGVLRVMMNGGANCKPPTLPSFVIPRDEGSRIPLAQSACHVRDPSSLGMTKLGSVVLLRITWKRGFPLSSFLSPLQP